MMLLCAVLTALISVNGAVAALVPVVVVTAVRLRAAASRLLMPLAFAAHAGSMLALTGSPVNVIVSEAANDAGRRLLRLLRVHPRRRPALAGTVAIVVLLGRRLLPDRKPRHISGLQRPRPHAAAASTSSTDAAPSRSTDRRSGVAEVVIPPRSGLVGEPAFPGMVTDSGDLVVLAVQRNGRATSGPARRSSPPATRCCSRARGTPWRRTSTIPTCSSSTARATCAARRCRSGRAPSGRRSSSSRWSSCSRPAPCPPAVASLLAAGALVLTRVVTLEQAYRAISWTTVVLVAGMIPLSTAMTRERRRRQARRPAGRRSSATPAPTRC